MKQDVVSSVLLLITFPKQDMLSDFIITKIDKTQSESKRSIFEKRNECINYPFNDCAKQALKSIYEGMSVSVIECIGMINDYIESVKEKWHQHNPIIIKYFMRFV